MHTHGAGTILVTHLDIFVLNLYFLDNEGPEEHDDDDDDDDEMMKMTNTMAASNLISRFLYSSQRGGCDPIGHEQNFICAGFVRLGDLGMPPHACCA